MNKASVLRLHLFLMHGVSERGHLETVQSFKGWLMFESPVL